VPGSNDLMPASGTIEARPKRASPIRPAAAPIEVEQDPTPEARPATPLPVSTEGPKHRRARVSARRGKTEHPVRVYVFMGLAIGIGIVLAYWLYWSLHFGRH